MFAYCLNNPVNMADNCGYAPEGLIAISLLSFLDGPLPFVVVLVGTTLLVFATYQLASETTSLLPVIIVDRADTSFIPELKKNKEPTRIPAPGPQKNTKRDNDVLVYRWAKRRSSSAREYQNLTPRPWTDDDGLSFSLVPTTSKENATTTLGALREAGFVCAVNGNHVSVMPAGGVVALNSWKRSYDTANSNPHELTLLLYNITW